MDGVAGGPHGPGPSGRVNPAGIVYGVLSVATVIAAESTRSETFPRLVVASFVAMVLYWLAHGYAEYWAAHLQRSDDWSSAEIWASLVWEAPILLGAAVPILALLLSWAVGGSTEAAVTAALWVSAVEIVMLELGAGLFRHDRLRDVAIQVLMGATMGLGILALRLILH
jgi:hypothetical protein